MKKTFCQNAMVLLSSVLLLAGCGVNMGTKEVSSNDNAGTEELKITIAGGSAGGAWSTIGEGLGETIKRSYPESTFTYQPGQDGANVMTVDTGQADFGIVSTAAAKRAYEGKEPFSSKIEKVRAVAFLHTMPYHFVVSEDSGITSIDQIADEKLPFITSVGTKDSAMEMASRLVFESYGISYGEIEKNGGKIQYLASPYDQIKDNKMDGTLSPFPIPTGSLVELNTARPIKLLPLSNAAIKKLEDELGAKPYTIEPGAYPFIEEKVPTASIDTLLITSSDTPEDEVYKITKAIYEQLDFLYTVHQSFEGVSKETIASATGAPLHPGAEKFYKEADILK